MLIVGGKKTSYSCSIVNKACPRKILCAAVWQPELKVTGVRNAFRVHPSLRLLVRSTLSSAAYQWRGDFGNLSTKAKT